MGDHEAASPRWIPSGIRSFAIMKVVQPKQEAIFFVSFPRRSRS